MSKYGPEALDPDWEEQAEELYEETVLGPKQSKVHVLTDAGLSRQEIADELDISTSTVDNHRQDIKEHVHLAIDTVEQLSHLLE